MTEDLGVMVYMGNRTFLKSSWESICFLSIILDKIFVGYFPRSLLSLPLPHTSHLTPPPPQPKPAYHGNPISKHKSGVYPHHGAINVDNGAVERGDRCGEHLALIGGKLCRHLLEPSLGFL